MFGFMQTKFRGSVKRFDNYVVIAFAMHEWNIIAQATRVNPEDPDQIRMQAVESLAPITAQQVASQGASSSSTQASDLMASQRAPQTPSRYHPYETQASQSSNVQVQGVRNI